MTERFTEIVSTETLKDNQSGKEYKPVLLTDELLELLNKLSIENEMLKKQNKFLEKRLECIINSLQSDLNNYGMVGRFK